MAAKIQQGVKAPNTTPTQIRIDKEQLRMLKILAAVNQTSISDIVRESLGKYIEDHLGSAAAQQAFAKFVTEASEGASPQEKAAQARYNQKIEDPPTDD